MKRPKAAASSSWPRRDTVCAARELHEMPDAEFVPFTAQTRMSGVDMNGDQLSARARPMPSRLVSWAAGCPSEWRDAVERHLRPGGTPLVVADQGKALGVIYLKDIVKGGLASASSASAPWASAPS